MYPAVRLVLFALSFALVLPQIYAFSNCETPDYAAVTSPTYGSSIPPSGLFTVEIVFPEVLNPSSFVQVELQTPDESQTVDVTAQFLPPAQTDFDGVSSASASLDAGALGFVPGELQLLVRLGINSSSNAGTLFVKFFWLPDTACEEAVAAAFQQCFDSVSDATRQCYLNTGASCGGTSAFAAERAQIETAIQSACTAAPVSAIGYGRRMNAAALSDRLIEECVGNAATLAARFFGGPQGAVLAQGFDIPCLEAGYTASASLMSTAYGLQSACVIDEAACSPTTVDSDVALAKSTEQANIEADCTLGSFDLLAVRVGIDADTALDRALLQTECMLSASHGDTAPLALRCAPGSLQGVTVVGTDPPGQEAFGPGVPTQLMLDGSVWDTRCGDGSPYYFWVEMPSGGPANNVHLYAKGGGACFSTDCAGVAATSPGSFMASDDGYQTQGILNRGGIASDESVDPYTTWTKADFPYCTQDLHIGGGVSQDNGNIIVERYGANNIRAGMQIVENLIAERLNDQDLDGYRADQVKAVFSGTSAGAFGVVLNLHYVLDELRWADTTFAAGAGSNVNAGAATSLGVIALQGWGGIATAPPYCLEATCVVPTPALYTATSARLLGTPAQQLLVSHNQIDDTQRDTQLFGDTPTHVNAMRQTYCDIQNLPGIYWFIAAEPTSIHPLYAVDSLDTTLTAGGVILSDWTNDGVFNPGGLEDEVDEGTLVTSFPGVNPFPCTLN